MTDRHYAFTVALKEDMREDDTEAIRNAISCIKGVLSVTPHVSGPEMWTATERVRFELQQKLMEVLYPRTKG